MSRMNYSEAVRLAKEGNEEGYTFLYENTYKSKLYLAIKYMKNEEAAEDVLQDAYIRAFTKLDTLENPETFPAWLGQIVANTAKNELKKNNPLLFVDVAQDEEGESFEFQIEDDNLEVQPEKAYTRQETQTLVHELIDGLSEEQRICILMFHIEGLSIHEIAETLGCSENTVKSRLNYGRKNIKGKAEELKKKGYELYSIAPFPLLLFLLRSEESSLIQEGVLTKAGKRVGAEVFSQITSKGSAAGQATAQGASQATAHSASGASAASQAAGQAIKAGVLHTTIGKTLAIIAGVCVLGGGAAGIWGVTQHSERRVETERVEADAQKKEKKIVDKIVEAKQFEESKEKQVQDEEYASLIEGNLTKKEVEFVLAYGPGSYPRGTYGENEDIYILNRLCEGPGSPLKLIDKDKNYRHIYQTKDIHRIFSSFTEYRFTEENNSGGGYGLDVDGDLMYVPVATLEDKATATITSATYTEQEMRIYYFFDQILYDSVQNIKEDRVAILKPTESGKYRIVKIEKASAMTQKEQTSANKKKKQESSGKDMDNSSLEELYKGVLQSIQNKEEGYRFETAGKSQESPEYFLHDMNGDGIKELVVSQLFPDGRFMAYECKIFTCVKNGAEYQIQQVGEPLITLELFIPKDNRGVFTEGYSMGNGEIDINRVTIESSSLRETDEVEFIMASAEEERFTNDNPKAPWHPISDLSKIDEMLKN